MNYNKLYDEFKIAKTVDELNEIKERIRKRIIEISNRDKETINEIDDILDKEGMVVVAGYKFYPSEILKKLDSVAYNKMCNNYFIDELEKIDNLLTEINKKIDEIRDKDDG